MEQRKTNKKKLVVALAILALIVVASVITTVVLVLAANQQNINSNVNVTYSVTDVSVKITGKYGLRESKDVATVSLVSMGEAKEFTPSDDTQTASVQPSGPISLSSDQNFVVFEYLFENTSEKAFTISLTYTDDHATTDSSPEDKNVTVKFTSSSTQITEFASATVGGWGSTFTSTECAGNTSKYVYVYVAVTNLTEAAGFSGVLAFNLSSSES